jgi:saccharopine dehydrogenase-like NADP-dependent oxidoreductase
VETVDRYDDRLRFTSMARTTAFTGAIVARMMARGDLKAQGLFTPEQVITGPLLKRLLEELAAENVRFEETTEEVRPLGSSTDRLDLSKR